MNDRIIEYLAHRAVESLSWDTMRFAADDYTTKRMYEAYSRATQARLTAEQELLASFNGDEAAMMRAIRELLQDGDQ
jgi:hypothetical protein